MLKIYVQYIAKLNARCINCVPYSVAAIFVTLSERAPCRVGEATNGGKEEYTHCAHSKRITF